MSLEQAAFNQEPLAEVLKSISDDDPYNVTLDMIEELDPELRTRLTENFDVVTRKDALTLEPFRLQMVLGLNQFEVRQLRSHLIGNGPIPQVEWVK